MHQVQRVNDTHIRVTVGFKGIVCEESEFNDVDKLAELLDNSLVDINKGTAKRIAVELHIQYLGKI